MNLLGKGFIIYVTCAASRQSSPGLGQLRMVWEERTRSSYPLSVKRGNKSRHLIFWSLGTLTGFRVWIRRLNAQREDISTLNTP